MLSSRVATLPSDALVLRSTCWLMFQKLSDADQAKMMDEHIDKVIEALEQDKLTGARSASHFCFVTWVYCVDKKKWCTCRCLYLPYHGYHELCVLRCLFESAEETFAAYAFRCSLVYCKFDVACMFEVSNGGVDVFRIVAGTALLMLLVLLLRMCC